MSNSIVSRPLLLEQLESRCLLAGGVFEHSATLANLACDRSASEDRTGDSPTFASLTSGNGHRFQLRIDPLQTARRYDLPASALGTRFQTPPPSVNQQQKDQPPPNVGQIQQKPAGTSTQWTIVFRPSVTTTSSDSGNGQPSAASTTRLGIGSALSNSTDLSQTATLATEIVRELSVSDQQSARMEYAPVDMVLNKALAKQIDLFESSSYQRLNHPLETRDHADDLSMKTLGGLIENLPALQHEFKEHENLQSEEPWELDHAALQELRSAATDTNEDRLETRKAVDLTIANWFDNPTGLIDDIQCAQDLPSSLQELTPSIVDVVLDATVGLHRSVGLIANGDIKRQPNSVRDSILAAIAAEHPLHSVPLQEQTPARVSGIAYPGVAIVVSTLAMAGRHRSKTKLESSK